MKVEIFPDVAFGGGQMSGQILRAVTSESFLGAHECSASLENRYDPGALSKLG